MRALLSIITLHNYEPTLFDDMVIPSGVDKELLIDNIKLELAELELVYTDPNFLKFAIGRWSAKELKVWEDLYNTTILDYDPIENYNRTETSTEKETRDLAETDNQTRDITLTEDETRDLAGSDNETRDLSASNDSTVIVDGDVVEGGQDITTRKKAGFDDVGLSDSESNTNDYGRTTASDNTTITEQDGTDTGTINKATTDTGTVEKEMSDSGTINNSKTDTGEVLVERDSNIKGNIGVTTTQQMLQQERDIVEFNIYDYIVASFNRRFCIGVW